METKNFTFRQKTNLSIGHWIVNLYFDQLKEPFVNALVLAKWTPGLETAIECDSSRYAVGGTLMQKVDEL